MQWQASRENNVQEPTSKRLYPQWQALYKSFFDRSYYVDAADNGNGTGCLYIFTVCLAAALISAGVMALSCYAAMKDPNMLALVQQVPKMTFAGGQISIDKPTPYQIKDPAGTALLEFRTNDSGEAKLSEPGPPIVITKDTVTMATGHNGGTRVIKLSDLLRKPASASPDRMASTNAAADRFSFDSNDLLNGIKSILFWTPIGLFIIFAPLVFIGHLLQLLIYGLVAQLLCNNAEQTIPYSTGMRLAALAITPNMVIAMTAALISSTFHAGGLQFLLAIAWAFFSIILAIVYLAMAASALKKAHVMPA